MKNTHLLIIDPQNDFCDLPESWRPTHPLTGERMDPSLPVAGAHDDMLRLAGFIRSLPQCISDITVTLDSHHRIDIAHPTFWQDADGRDVAPFTQITSAQLASGQYLPRDPHASERASRYLQELEAQGRYTLMVWPVHCEIGTWGHNVHAAVLAACQAWETAALRPVQFVNKGDNPWTEHYSALRAEVPDAGDPATELNRALVQRLDTADLILIAGEASSHCVRATTEHLADHLPSGRMDRLVLLTDTMSPVSGFEAEADRFLQAMTARGARCAKVAEAAQLLA